MGDLKPIGSERLEGDDKLARILELTYYQNPKKSALKPSTSAEFISESTNGSVYGIVKEKDGYYVKKGLNETTLDYIGGMFMKNKNKFHSYGDALKRLTLIKGQEELQEATKYVLKQNKPTPPPPQQSEAPAPQAPMPEPPPSPDAGTVPPPDGTDSFPQSPDAGTDDFTPSDQNTLGEPSNEDDYLKIIQKLSGRLAQKLREYEDKLESDDIKYVLNMVISAVDLDKLNENDRDEILDEFDNDDQEDSGLGEPDMGSTSDETGSEDFSGGSQNEDDIDETMDTLENLINTPWDDEDENDIPDESVFDNNVDFDDDVVGDEDDLNYSDDEDIDYPNDSYKEDRGRKVKKFRDHDEEPEDDNVRELDIDELTNMINGNIKQTLGKYFK